MSTKKYDESAELAKQLASKERARSKCDALTSQEEVNALAAKLAVKALGHASLATRLVAVGELDAFVSESSIAAHNFATARELIGAFEYGRIRTLEARLTEARVLVQPDKHREKQLQQREKLAAKREASAAKKVTKAAPAKKAPAKKAAAKKTA